MPYRAEFDANEATVGELVAEVLTLRADLALIAASFVTEAIQREWCGDYERWARIINRKTSRPHFIIREGKDWVVAEAEAAEHIEVAQTIGQCTCEVCAPNRDRDPSLDESGRFSVQPPNPTWAYRVGCECENCRLLDQGPR